MLISISNISVSQLKRAVVIREQLEKLELELAGILGESRATSTNGRGGRGKMSPAARARIAAAQRLRWAKHRKGASASAKTSGKAAKGKRKLSPATKAKIAAAARIRWARAKAANRRTLAAA
ncbi:MAG TPA: hypothetical protein VFC07_09245 [Verrucomicrobiae bacterium]|nr:hypothetical protein [Verrucomicrobiae bacterium]